MKEKWNQRMPVRLFWIIVLFLMGCYVAVGVAGGADPDMYFIAATGKAIRTYGIFRTNLWCVEPSDGFIAQQWLYAVIFSALSDIGFAAVCVYKMVEILLFAGLVYWFCKRRNLSFTQYFIGLCLLLFFNGSYCYTVRPQLCTLNFLLMESLALEQYQSTKKWQYLLCVPITVILEMNFHMSMWFLHYAVLLAYVCPSFYWNKVRQDALWKDRKAWLFCLVLMTAGLFVNPYGLDGVLYVVRSFQAHTFEYIPVTEMKSVPIVSYHGFMVILFVIWLVLVLRKENGLTSSELNMCVGWIIYMALALRNTQISSLPLLYLYIAACRFLQEKMAGVDWQKDVKWNTLPLLLLVCFGFGGYTVSKWISNGSKDLCMLTDDGLCLSVVEDYLTERNVALDTPIFTDFDTGSFLEYAGFTSLYIDARPELYTPPFTGGRNVLADCYGYAYTGMRAEYGFAGSLMSLERVTAKEMQAWLEKYDFQYFVFNEFADMHLKGYLEMSDTYERVVLDNTGRFVLYQKK